MTLQNLTDLFVHELRDLYSAEEQIIHALPTMIKASSDQDLKLSLKRHLDVTQEQLKRLDRIAAELEVSLEGHTCKGMKGIIDEGNELLEMIEDSATKDAAVIASAQRVEHYEIAGYGCALHFAEELELESIAELLEQTLEEEFEADEELSSLAEGGMLSVGINEEAK